MIASFPSRSTGSLPEKDTMRMPLFSRKHVMVTVGAVLVATPLWAQTPAAQAPPGPPPAQPTAAVVVPPDYVIGAADVLTISVWKEADLTTDVVVRPDGKITLPLLNDIVAAGLTPEELRVKVTAAAGKFLESPTVSVIVKAMNSRNVYITGQVMKPGAYPLLGPTNVTQLIALAGGVQEFSNSKKILIIRGQTSFKYNYKDVLNGKNLKQNIELKPGDTITVP